MEQLLEMQTVNSITVFFFFFVLSRTIRGHGCCYFQSSPLVPLEAGKALSSDWLARREGDLTYTHANEPRVAVCGQSACKQGTEDNVFLSAHFARFLCCCFVVV
ncbi:hypothetical protein CDAR_532191 [Caerostris darwini]|uniref:Secreted protein n=1 Tax=Caerostris darwini TaxID=1538125 RepID=A0AAV4PPH4_9ARAC|nr:hypothetical protein CDAR_532191 [Caerostris darwini]